MSTIPEQFSAASKSQIEAQLELLGSFGARAFDGAARLVALNIETGRAAVDSSSEAFKQLAEVRDPRDLIALAKGTPDFTTVMDYGREWFNIVTDVQAGLFKAAVPYAPAPAPQARQEYAPAPQAREESTPAPAAEAAPEAPADAAPAVEARTVKPSKKPVVAVKPEPEQGPAAEEKPIARAAGKVAGKAPELKPAAAMPKAAAQAMPHVKPVEATPPPAVFQQDLLTPKRGKKR